MGFFLSSGLAFLPFCLSDGVRSARLRLRWWASRSAVASRGHGKRQDKQDSQGEPFAEKVLGCLGAPKVFLPLDGPALALMTAQVKRPGRKPSPCLLPLVGLFGRPSEQISILRGFYGLVLE